MILQNAFNLGSFRLNLFYQDQKLIIKAVDQVSWSVYDYSMTNIEVRNQIPDICSNSKELYFLLSEGLSGVYPQVQMSMDQDGRLSYFAKLEVGGTPKTYQFYIQLIETVKDHPRYEGYFHEVRSKLIEQSWEIETLKEGLLQLNAKLEEGRKSDGMKNSGNQQPLKAENSNPKDPGFYYIDLLSN